MSFLTGFCLGIRDSWFHIPGPWSNFDLNAVGMHVGTYGGFYHPASKSIWADAGGKCTRLSWWGA